MYGTLPLPDSVPPRSVVVRGRRLSFGLYGAPRGQPVVACHGWPGSRLLGAMLDDAACRHGIQLIVPDRPGMGQSEFDPHRTLLDWPRDVAAVADALGLETFAVLGYSGGGGYALACGWALPERVSKVVLVSSMAPLDDPAAAAAVPSAMRAVFATARLSPRFVEPLLKPAQGVARRIPESLARTVLHFGLAGTTFGGRVALLEAFRRELSEALRHGPKGVAYEASLNAKPWGFRLEEISIPALLFHGEADVNVPVAMGRCLARRLPRCTPLFIEGAGHFWLFDRADEVFAAAVSAA